MSKSLLEAVYPEATFGGYSRVDGTVAFYSRVQSLLGPGAVALDVEALDLRLEDVTKPYLAPSRRSPDHG